MHHAESNHTTKHNAMRDDKLQWLADMGVTVYLGHDDRWHFTGLTTQGFDTEDEAINAAVDSVE